MSHDLDLVPISCPLCHSAEWSRFLETVDYAHGIGGLYRLVRCRSCGHVYLNPAPTADSLAACYPAEYVPHRDPAGRETARELTMPATSGVAAAESSAGSSPIPHRGTDTLTTSSPSARTPWYLSSFVRRLPGVRRGYYWLTDRKSQCVPPVVSAGRTALEIGCATGDFLLRLQQAGWKVQGLDLVEGPVEVARGRGLTVHHGDLRSARFPDATFDDVFAWMVVEHLPDPVETLQEVVRILKPGGWFCFSIPNFGSPERILFGKYWRGYDLPRHLQHFTIRRIRRLLTSVGLEPRQIIHQPCFLNWLGSAGLAWEHWCPRLSLGRKLNDWFWNNPPLWVYFVLGPFAHLQAACRLGGRLTLLAQKPDLPSTST